MNSPSVSGKPQEPWTTPLPSTAYLEGKEPSALSGVNVLLEGPTGVGKTYAIGTLVESGIEVFYLDLESGLETVIGYFTDRGKPIPENLHWHKLQLFTEGGGFKWMGDAAKQIGQMTYEQITKIQDFERSKNNQFEKFLTVMNGFTDQRTGKNFGPVDTWGPDRAIVIDGLTGVGTFAMGMVVGKKPVSNQPDYLVAQTNVERFLRYTCDGCRCHFILLSHVERENDPVAGTTKITVATLGRALAPKIPPMFSDVIYCVRNGTEWTWDTSNILVDLKTRNLPIQAKNPPDFSQIISKWKSRGGRLSPTVKT